MVVARGADSGQLHHNAKLQSLSILTSYREAHLYHTGQITHRNGDGEEVTTV